ncbi:SWIM zinc finger family protein [Paenibacillus lignilyticus]|uniref:SWIM zinc finger family protein n=1 Tax=Paenibacillus lignilyticus TaxID=1172615 RepID=A0ABS5CHM6_9BACL|nr:SWIM zinc finger family protein [Paenibacillus lignilyticus]MBP3965373.1 SWIM zinc finger family protein [Paenibacillus lignilyticus]
MTMKLPFSIDDAAWTALVAQVGTHFDDLTIKRGFQYYKQDRVHTAIMTEPTVVEAAVDGSEMYDVVLNLQNVRDSECSCPVKSRGCKHVIAVLLYYAAMQGRSVHAIVNARSAAVASANASAKGTKVIGKAAVAARPAALSADELTALSIAEWHSRFGRTLGPFNNSPRFLQEAKEMLTGIHNMKPHLTLVPEQLFNLHAYLFVLEKLVKPAQEDWRHSGHFMGYHTQLAMDELLEAALRCLAEPLPIGPASDYWPRVNETLAYLRAHMLREDRSLNCFAKLYQVFWMKWIRPNLDGGIELVEEELRELQQAEDVHGQHLSRVPWMLAQCLLFFELHRDEDAWALLRAEGKRASLQPGQVDPLLEALVQAEAWPRLVSWLEQVGPMLSRYRSDDFNSYGGYWETALTHVQDAEPRMWATLGAMLPYSRHLYEDALLSYGRWQQWMDFQISSGKEPLEFKVGVLKPIEKDAPELLLPFYHQAVERYVLLKNRDSYKAAVKLLKRLNKLYKKTKQDARWDVFISAFTARHSRLRALQEELRKGGLLS